MKEEELYDLIDSYLQGSLPKDHPFHQRILVDGELAEEVAVQKIVKSAVIENRLKDVSAEIRSLQTPDQPKTSWRKWLISGMIFLVTSAAIFYVILHNESPKIKSSKLQGQAAAPIAPQIKNADEKLPSEVMPSASVMRKNQPSAYSIPYTSPSEVLNKIHDQPAPMAEEPQQVATVSSVQQGTFEPPVSIPLNICDTTKITAEVAITNPCQQMANGSIHVLKVKGGKKPYEYSIDHSESFQKSQLFDELKPGEYDLIVKDHNGCMKQAVMDIRLTFRECSQLHSFSFDPTIQTWEVPFEHGKSGRITIVDKSGRTVFTKTFAPLEQLFWTGTSSNGETLQPGAYIYMIEYGDGSSQKGEVTLSY